MEVSGRVTEFRAGKKFSRLTLTNMSGDWHFKISDKAKGRIPEINEFVKIKYDVSELNGYNHKWVQEFKNP